jgi:hypothetical protein
MTTKRSHDWASDIDYASDDAWGEFVGDVTPLQFVRRRVHHGEPFSVSDIETAVEKWNEKQDESDYEDFQASFDDNFEVPELIVYYIKKHYGLIDTCTT